MNNLNDNTILLMRAVAELRRQGLEPKEHLKRWINLCAALTTDLEAHFCERDSQVSNECTIERRKLLKAG
tara:strand:+ start:112 stop:321 length:210 start_codon:yes stop_codon:yes gene_type:complete